MRIVLAPGRRWHCSSSRGRFPSGVTGADHRTRSPDAWRIPAPTTWPAAWLDAKFSRSPPPGMGLLARSSGPAPLHDVRRHRRYGCRHHRGRRTRPRPCGVGVDLSDLLRWRRGRPVPPLSTAAATRRSGPAGRHEDSGSFVSAAARAIRARRCPPCPTGRLTAPEGPRHRRVLVSLRSHHANGCQREVSSAASSSRVHHTCPVLGRARPAGARRCSSPDRRWPP